MENVIGMREWPQVRLLVEGYYPEKEIRTAETSAAVPHVAAVPQVRKWMVKRQRECVQFGNLVMEGRDIGTNVFPETDFKFYLDAKLEERSRRRAADGVQENLAARDQRDSQRADGAVDDRAGRQGHQQFEHDFRADERFDSGGDPQAAGAGEMTTCLT